MIFAKKDIDQDAADDLLKGKRGRDGNRFKGMAKKRILKEGRERLEQPI